MATTSAVDMAKQAGIDPKRFRKALRDRSHPQPRVINTDLAPIYTSAIPAIRRKELSGVAVGTDLRST